MPDIRADLALYQRGLCKSRERARKLIKNGNVQINGMGDLSKLKQYKTRSK